MNNDFRYILEPYKGLNSRVTCPACKKRNQFARYFDQETNEPLANIVGRCNREINCGYHYTPKEYFEAQKLTEPNKKTPSFTVKLPSKETKKKPSAGIPFIFLKKSRKAYDQNNFAKYLFDKIGKETAMQVLSLYHVGTSKHWFGATVFWQIDIFGKVRAGKIMLYNKETGHRIKEPYPHINWIHKLVKLKDYNLNQCLFGEHLLKVYPNKPTAIVESEKTAILGAAYQPTFNWLAAGNLNNLSRERCQPLKGKTVFLFPDAGAFKIWNKKAQNLKDLASFIVSDLIEKHATPEQIKKGYDLGDYFEGQPKTMFTGRKEFEQTPNIKTITKTKIPENVKQMQDTFETDFDFIQDQEDPFKKEPLEVWPIDDLEAFFSSVKIPKEPIQLNNASTITNPNQFIKTHLATIKANNGKQIFKPHFERLLALKQFLSKIN